MKKFYNFVKLCLYSWIFILSFVTQSQQSAINSMTGSSRVNTAPAQCAEHEYGQNCVYCVPQDTCDEGHYTCDNKTGSKVCLPGYFGADCMDAEIQGTMDYQVKCPENDCRNGGVCTSGKCCCGRGFAGVLCEIEIIECRNNSCQNGGVCKDLVGNFECICKPSFTGDKCQIRSDAHARTTPSLGVTCKTTQCLNGGTCFEDMYFTYCLCQTNFSGHNCETDLRNNPPQTHNCPADYYGQDCHTFCKPQNDCHGHYVCDQSTGNKICLSGWHGNKCDTRILPQSLDPECPTDTGCKNDGQCMENECCCRHNYTGKYCQIESIGCLSNPCMNNATCYNVGNGFTCACVGNFTGRTCDHVIEPPTSTRTPPTTSKTPPTSTKTPPTTSKTPPTSAKSLTSSRTPPSTSQTPPTTAKTPPAYEMTSTPPLVNNSSPRNQSISPLHSSLFTTSLSNNVMTSSSATTYLPSMQFTTLHSTISLTTPYSSSSSSSSSLSSSLPSSAFVTSPFTSQISPTVTSPPPSSLSESPITSSTIDLNPSSTSNLLSKPLPVSSAVAPTSTISFTAASVTSEIPLTTSSSSFTSAQSTTTLSSPSLSSSHSSVVSMIQFTNSPSATASSSASKTKSALDSSTVQVSPAILNSSPVMLSSSGGSNLISTTVVSPNHSEHLQTPPILTSSTSKSTSRDNKSSASTLPTAVYKPTRSSSIPVQSTSVHLNTIGMSASPSIKYSGSDVISTLAPDGNGISTNWKIALIVVGCVLLLLLLIILIVILTVRQRKKDSMYISQSPADLHGYSKEHFSVQPDFNNPTFDEGNDSDNDSVKHDINVCHQNPCVHGVCSHISNNDYRCFCWIGYEGRNCSTLKTTQDSTTSTLTSMTSTQKPTTSSTTLTTTNKPRVTQDYGPKCLKCVDVISPETCEYIAQCGPREVCYVEQYITSIGGIRYNLGCRDSNICQSSKRDISSIIKSPLEQEPEDNTNILSCVNCCNGDLCNSGGCGFVGFQTMATQQRGPICYHCQQQTNPKDCNKIRRCGIAEYCAIQKTQVGTSNVTLFTSGCQRLSVTIQPARCIVVGGTYVTTIAVKFDFYFLNYIPYTRNLRLITHSEVNVESCTKSELVISTYEAADDGLIFIEGQDDNCKHVTSSGVVMYTFDFIECNIQWEMLFRIVVQKNRNYQTGADKVIPIFCVADRSDIIVASSNNAEKTDDSSQNVTVKPSARMSFFKVVSEEEVSGREVKLSDTLIMTLELNTEFIEDFDIKAKYCVASNIVIIEEYCSTDTELFPNFQRFKQGYLMSEFGAFRTTNYDSSAIEMNFTCVLDVCRGPCLQTMCNWEFSGTLRKKRSLGESSLSDQHLNTDGVTSLDSRIKRQAEDFDIDVGGNVRIVEKYSEIKIVTDETFCMDQSILIFILIFLVAGVILFIGLTYIFYRKWIQARSEFDDMKSNMAAKNILSMSR
ncbi:hypothetical protein ACF0H5_024543 [Mactra antiquata]